MLLELNMPRKGGVGVERWLKAHPEVTLTMRMVVIKAWAKQDMTSLVDFLRLPWFKMIPTGPRWQRE